MAKRKVRAPTALASPRKTRSATARMAKEESQQEPVSSPLLAVKETEEETVADVVKMPEKETQQAPVPSLLRKKTKTKPTKRKAKKEETVVDVAAKTSVSGKLDSIIIEACKQCQSFKRTALRVKDGIGKNMSEVEVIINPEKPRRGCFEVRNVNGEIFVSLLELKRPFKKMKELNLDDVVADIVKKMNSVKD